MTLWFWVVSCDNTVDNPLVTGKGDLKGVDPWDLRRGFVLDRWDPSAWLQPPSPEWDGEPDDVLQEHLGIPVYSRRLREGLLDAELGGIQYLPIRVLHYDGTPIEGFAVANILNVLPALDKDRSDYDVFPDDYFLPERRGLVRAVRIPVLRRSVLSGCHVIRLQEFPMYICVSERFRQVFEKCRFTGYSFHEIAAV